MSCFRHVLVEKLILEPIFMVGGLRISKQEKISRSMKTAIDKSCRIQLFKNLSVDRFWQNKKKYWEQWKKH